MLRVDTATHRTFAQWVLKMQAEQARGPGGTVVSSFGTNSVVGAEVVRLPRDVAVGSLVAEQEWAHRDRVLDEAAAGASDAAFV
ncbi:MAG TPA: hypothetical protein VJU61_09720 [Polyangiaceae bacterium]|nr:hypothetical protein [Polyangiaceae bacterium]